MIDRSRFPLSEEEKNKCLFELNRTQQEYCNDKTIHQLFEEQVEKTPDHVAVVGESTASMYLPSIRCPPGTLRNTLTYRELNERANRLACYLQQQGVRDNEIVGILTERTIEMVVGILGILKAGGAYVPLSPKVPAARNRYILDECSTRFLLTTRELIEKGSKPGIGREGEQKIEMGEARRIFSEECWREPMYSPLQSFNLAPTPVTNVAYVIFTSGSTGKPKGVPITHANLSPLLHWGYEKLDFGAADRTIQNLSYYFDWSVWEIFMTLTTGAALYMASEEVLLNPAAQVQFIKENRITILHITPSQMQFLAEANQPLETLQYLFIGAEKLIYNLVERSFELVREDCRVFNMYGPTEATIISAVLEIDRLEYKEFEKLSSIPIGTAAANAELLVLDENYEICPVDTKGELYISGHGLSHGYLADPEKTADSFIENIFQAEGIRGERLYKTGDLVRWLPDGNIEFLGRIDHQVKIRSFRIELGEIEKQLLRHEKIEAVVVTAREKAGNKYLCAYVVARGMDQGAVSEELREFLSQSLPDYMIPSYFIPIKKIPINLNGKVDLKALPDPEAIETYKEYAAPRDDLERKLIEIWADILKIDSASRIGIEDNFFELGGHSLRGSLLAARLHKEFDVRIPLEEFFRLPTIRELSDYIKGAKQEKYFSIKKTEKKEYYPLSSSQKRLYILHQVELKSINYNIPILFELEEKPDPARLEDVFCELIVRHESFRTSFLMINDEPVQRIHSPEEIKFEIEYHDLDKKFSNQNSESGRGESVYVPGPVEAPYGHQEFIKNFIRPFDLSQAPLLRVGLIKLAEEKYLLLLDMHHIITDGTSVEILQNELIQLYGLKDLPTIELQYKDYAEWQKGEKPEKKIVDQKKYWLNQFEGDLPLLNLPLDYPRPPLQSFAGSTINFTMTGEERETLLILARGEKATLFMILLAIYSILLMKLSGQEEVILGIPEAGRQHDDLENIIGMFVSTVVLRIFPTGEKTFKQLLREINQTTLSAFENREYHFEYLVEELKLERDASRNPIFDVMFALQNMEAKGIFKRDEGCLNTKPYKYISPAARVDMTLFSEERGEGISFDLEYCPRLFKEETIRRFIGYFQKITNTVVENPWIKIGEIQIILEEEKKKIVEDFNKTGAEYPRDKTIHKLFEEQVEKTPARIAVAGMVPGDRTREDTVKYVTYHEIDSKSKRLAYLLRKKGISRNSIAAVMVEPSIEMIVGIMAILKAGGCYLPIDPEQPVERITFMLRESQTTCLLTQEHLSKPIQFTGEILDIDIEKNSIYAGDDRNIKPINHPGDGVYMIYTSGTTGKSKGVLLRHENLVNYVWWFKNNVRLMENERTVLTSSFAFDLGYTSIYPSILSGWMVHIISKENYATPEHFINYIGKHEISYLKLTPSLFSMIAESSYLSEKMFQKLRLVVLGGEEIRLKDVEKVHGLCSHIQFMNHYGPTEATIGSVAQFIDFSRFSDYLQRPTIGRPIHNTQVYILDKWLNVLPVGVSGELFLSGACTASGYLNQPELTSGKFVDTGRYPGLPLDSTLNIKYLTLYKTGDLARWTGEGTIEFLGRVDHQVKIRGYRIELGEIESQLLNHHKIDGAVVIVREGERGDKYICAYLVAKAQMKKGTGIETEQLTPGELREYLSKNLPNYMIPAYFMILEKLPLTPNGKVDMKALPEPEAEAGVEYVAPRDVIEGYLAGIWSKVLLISHEKIGIDDNFFELGGHSLKGTVVIANIQQRFNVRVPLAEIFKNPTIRRMAQYIKESEEEKHLSLEPAEKKEYYVLSSAQKRLYILNQMDFESTSYNMPAVYLLEGEVDRKRMENSFRKLIQRHESFRTSFHMVYDEPVQMIRDIDEVNFQIEYRTARDMEHRAMSATSIIENFVRPFDLSGAPLLRAGLIHVNSEKDILMFDMHHIVSDGISRIIFRKELLDLYQLEELPRLRLQYKEFAEWQNRENRIKKTRDLEEYWLKEFAGEIPILDLPLDFPRPAIQSFEGKTLFFELGKGERQTLNKLAKRGQATPFMILAAAFNILLTKLSGQEAIVMATPADGRKHSNFENIIGMFVNTLPLRNFPTGEKQFKEFLAEIKNKTLAAFENQEYPFEELVEQLVVNRDTSRNPLFDVMFVMENIERQRAKPMELKLSPHGLELQISKFDLTLAAHESGEALLFEVEYCTRLFRAETIRRFIEYYKKILSIVLENPETKIAEIELISEREKKQILEEFNKTELGYPKEKTIVELFVDQAAKSRHTIALTAKSVSFISEDSEDMYLTYQEANENANQMACVLKEKGIEPDSVVSLMVDRSIEMILAIIAILKAGGAYLPIDPTYPKQRIRFILADSGASILFTRRPIFKMIIKPGREKISKGDLWPGETIFIEESGVRHETSGIGKDQSDDRKICLGAQRVVSSPPPGSRRLSTTSPAYIIYTSGSSGKPKGVAVEHRNVTNLVFGLKEKIYKNDNQTLKVCLVAPYVFDASVQQIFAVLLLGHTLTIVPEDTRSDGLKLAAFYNKYGIDISDGTPTHIRLLLETLREGGKKGALALAGIKYFIIGGEALPGKVVEEFFTYFDTRALKIINVYGPAECCVDSTYYEISKEGVGLHPDIPIGHPLPNQQVYIKDNNNHLQPLGISGELCIEGDNISRGYLNQPGLTAEKFLENPCGPRLYRTGDLARWLPDGSIEFLGRMDQQVKIRGYRIELGEIENQLLNHEEIKETLVIDREMKGGERYLCAYIVCQEQVSIGEWREYLARTLPDYMIPSFFVRLQKLPITPNGKIDRKALPDPEPETGVAYVVPRDAVEERLVEIWSEVLGWDKGKIGIDDNFFQLGGHSLKGTVIMSRIHKEFNIRLALAELFKAPHIRGLAAVLRKGVLEKYQSIESLEKRNYYVVSSVQKRLYILDQMEFESIGYNMPAIYQTKKETDKNRLAHALQKLIARHESFRTSFTMVEDEPVQRIHDISEVNFEIEYYEKVSGQGRGEVFSVCNEVEQIINSFIHPFDLSRAPLLRVGLINTGEAYDILMIDMHHIISDGISMEIFQKELITLYESKELQPLRIQYKEYADWQNREKGTGKIKNQEEYWMKEFAGEIPVLNLPVDYIRPAVQSFSGDKINFELGEEETEALRQLAKKENATLFMVLAAAFSLLLAKLSGQVDIVVSTPTAGRRHVELENIIGMFVNTLALRNYPEGEKTFIEFLGEIKEDILEAFENQEYPFEDLVEGLMVNRDTSRNPLFDVMFALQNIQPTDVDGSDLRLTLYEYEMKISKFDMSLIAVEKHEKLQFYLEYCTRLFEEKTIKRFIGYFKEILHAVTESPGVGIYEIEIISREERQKILYDFNSTAAAYPGNMTLHGLFEEQAARTPDNIAVVGPGAREITYKELKKRADKLAWLLHDKCVRPNTIVGIMVNPSLAMMIGILGILKSSGAYLPLDPGYPQERTDYMLSDSGAEILLTGRDLGDKFQAGDRLKTCPDILLIDESRDERHSRSHPNLPPAPAAGLAYVIYTSGSTGKPKGILVEHRNVSAYLLSFVRQFDIRPTDTVIQLTSYTFDIFVEGAFSILLKGGKLVMPLRGDIMDVDILCRLIDGHRVTIVDGTPLLMNELNKRCSTILEGNPLQSVHTFISGGDVLKREYVEHLLSMGKIYNTYGPTETTICASYYKYELFSSDHSLTVSTSIPIGNPFFGCECYIQDKHHKMQPIGIAGELCISGSGVSRGYLNRSELTAEKFLENPCGPRLYYTGDLARWLPDGSIEFLGRLDQQVKIRGYRIELGEIENQLLNHEEIKEALVMDREMKGGERYLCAYIVCQKDISIGEWREYLARTLPHYMIPSFFVRLEKLPITPNGKIDRKALPDPEPGAGVAYVVPRDAVEERLVEIWSEVLGRDKGKIGIDDNFFQLGGHSLKGTVIMSRIHKEFNIRLALAELFKTPHIRGLAAALRKGVEERYISIAPVEKKEYYALSSAQRRLFILQQLELTDTTYNMTQVIPLPGGAEIEQLKETLKGLIERHESLRTTFHMMNDQPLQMIHRPEQIEFEIEYYGKLSGGSSGHDQVVRNFVKPFNLSLAPLFRIRLLETGNSDQLILVDMHHIISDGVSTDILAKEFAALYGSKDRKLPQLRIQYKDFAEWQKILGRQGVLEHQEAYWLKQFQPKPPLLDLPTDYPRYSGQQQRFKGGSIDFEIDKEELGRLQQIILAEEATMFMAILALLNILLSKLSGQEDIVIGTVTAGRRHVDLEQIIGFFVNTLPLRNYPASGKTFISFLREVKQRTLEAFENEDYQFEELVDKVEAKRDADRNPLFDVMFVLQTRESEVDEAIDRAFTLAAAALEQEQYEKRRAKFDLMFYCKDAGKRLSFSVEYSTKLFKKATIERYIGYFKEILSYVLNNKEIELAEIKISLDLFDRQLDNPEMDFGF